MVICKVGSVRFENICFVFQDYIIDDYFDLHNDCLTSMICCFNCNICTLGFTMCFYEEITINNLEMLTEFLFYGDIV